VTLISAESYPKNVNSAGLTVMYDYDINKSEVATSRIWNNETKTIEVCQVVTAQK